MCEIIVKYSYVILEKYADLEDGQPNFHHNPAVKVSGQGNILDLMKRLQESSKISKELSIVNIEFEVIT
jgi:hypothetical protein